MVSDNLKTAVGRVCGGPQVNKTRKIQDKDKTGTIPRQVNNKTGTRQESDRNKTGTRQEQDITKT